MCQNIEAELTLLPEGAVQKQLHALSLVDTEFKKQIIGIEAALERLFQIVTTVAKNSQTIETYFGQSPVPFILGEVGFIRLSYSYFAIVNRKGTKGALWTSSEDGSSWVELTDTKELASLNKCLLVHQGSAIPEIISIPVRMNIHLYGESL